MIPIVPRVSIDRVIDPKDDKLYFDPVLQTSYYNYYLSYGKYFLPKTVFEIGVRKGYTGYFILAGAAGAVCKYRGIDLETYARNSSVYARSLLTSWCSDVRVDVGNSHVLTDLGDVYDLIHIDGDHSYEGKVADLHLAKKSLSAGGVIVVDDCWNAHPKQDVYRAVVDFVKQTGMKAHYIGPLCGSSLNPTNGHALLQLA